MIGASMLEYIAIALSSNGADGSNVTIPCTISTWCGHLGFSVIFGVLIAKTWRLKAIMANKSLRKVAITNEKVITVVGVITAVTFVLLLVWTIHGAVDADYQLTSVVQVYERSNKFDAWVGCSSQEGGIYVLLLLLYEGSMLVAGAFLAFMVRQVPSQYN